MEQLQEQVNKLEEQWDLLTSSTTIPKEIDAAFRARLSDISQTISLSATDPTAHNQSVDESGSGSYSVLGIPTGYLTININGAPRDIPYY